MASYLAQRPPFCRAPGLNASLLADTFRKANVALEDETGKNRRLLSLSFVAYGRACDLAAKAANLDDPLIVPTSRGAQLGSRYKRQFQIQYDLLQQAGDPTVRPALDAFWTALRASQDGDSSADLRARALRLTHACGEAWKRATRESPRLRETIRRPLYERACAVADQLAAAKHLRGASHEYAEFWELYWGELAIVESPEVEAAMVEIGDVLKQWKQKGAAAPAGKLVEVLAEKAEALRAACRLPSTGPPT